MMRRLRGPLAVVYVGYLTVVAVLVLDPSQKAPGATLSLVSRVLQAAQLPVTAGSGALEVISNVVLFVPLSLLGAFLWPTLRIRDWVVAGVLFSVSIELCQLLFLPQRFATVSDVVANTSGTLIGALLASLVARRAPRRGWRLMGSGPQMPD